MGLKNFAHTTFFHYLCAKIANTFMKRIILLQLLVLSTIICTNADVYNDVTIGNICYDLYYNYGNPSNGGKAAEATVIRKTSGSYSGAINIPSSVTYNGKTFTVTEINYSAFFDAQLEITSVTIPNTVKKIGINAFLNCGNMKRLTIPASVTEIGKAAFDRCTFEALTIEGRLQSYSGVFDGLNTKSVVYCPESALSITKAYYKGPVYVIGTVVEPKVTEVVVDGVAYGLDLVSKTATATGRDPEAINQANIPQELTIRETVNANNTTYEVTKIAERAFSYDQNLATINIPNTVKSMGEYTFYVCRNLLKANIPSSLSTIPSGTFSGCESLRDVNIASGVSSIAGNAFNNCYMLAYYDPLFIPSTMRNINETAFRNCTGMIGFNVDPANTYLSSSDGMLYEGNYNKLLKCPPRCGKGEVKLPEQCGTIGYEAFYDCTDITVITAGNVTTVGGGAFRGCTALKHLRLSPMLRSIGAVAFADCKSLIAVTLPRTLTNIEVSGDLFNGCKLEQLVVLCPLNTTGGFQTSAFSAEWLSPHGRVYTYDDAAFKQAAPQADIRKIPEEGVISKVKSYFCGVDFNIPGLLSMGLIEGVKVGDGKASFDITGTCKARGLNSNWNYIVVATYKPYNGYEYEDYLGTIRTSQLSMSITDIKPTQTTVSGTVTIATDETFQPDETGVYLYGDYNHQVPNGGSFKLTGLKPNTSYYLRPYATKGDDTYNGNDFSFKTLGCSPVITLVKAGPTSIELRGSYSAGDATVKRAYLNNGETAQRVVTGLDPQTPYSFTFNVEYAEGGKETASKSFSTTQLQLETLTPKVVKQGEAVVAAKTNICDEETGAGFEWRKTDAPELVESKTADAVVYDGSLEGIIKNMTVGAYYKVRPYYRSTSGKSYYGNWTGIDPGEFSFFEPMVHTYASVDVQATTATLKGYAIRGSDDIKEQGFEYWVKSITRATASDVTRILATGQRMTAVLTGLQSNTTYAYRAFVTTDRGTTYGEEYTFDVPGTDTAVDGVKTVEPTAFDVYNMRGVRVRHKATSLEGLPAGLYIVNGKKRLVK